MKRIKIKLREAQLPKIVFGLLISIPVLFFAFKKAEGWLPESQSIFSYKKAQSISVRSSCCHNPLTVNIFKKSRL